MLEVSLDIYNFVILNVTFFHLIFGCCCCTGIFTEMSYAANLSNSLYITKHIYGPASPHHPLFSIHSRRVGIAGLGERMVQCWGSFLCDVVQCAYLEESELEGFLVILPPRY